jgi:hypothetical protein
MKILNVYGIKMSEVEEMAFAKFRSENNIAMNTLTEQERYEYTLNWLEKYLSESY